MRGRVARLEQLYERRISRREQQDLRFLRTATAPQLLWRPAVDFEAAQSLRSRQRAEMAAWKEAQLRRLAEEVEELKAGWEPWAGVPGPAGPGAPAQPEGHGQPGGGEQPGLGQQPAANGVKVQEAEGQQAEAGGGGRGPREGGEASAEAEEVDMRVEAQGAGARPRQAHPEEAAGVRAEEHGQAAASMETEGALD